MAIMLLMLYTSEHTALSQEAKENMKLFCDNQLSLWANNPGVKSFCDNYVPSQGVSTEEPIEELTPHQQNVIYAFLMMFYNSSSLLSLFPDGGREPKLTSQQRVVTKTKLDEFELEAYPLDEEKFMARRMYLRQCREDYQLILDNLTQLGYHRKARNAVIRYLEFQRLVDERSGIKNQHIQKDMIEDLKSSRGVKALVEQVWKQHKKFYHVRNFQQHWIAVAVAEGMESKLKGEELDYFIECRLQEQEGLVRDLTPGRFEAMVRRYAGPMTIGHAALSGYITSIGISTALLSIGLLPAASIPALSVLVVGQTVMSAYFSKSRRVANNTAIFVRNILDKGLSLNNKLYTAKFAAMVVATALACASGSYFLYAATESTAIAVTTMLAAMYSSAALRGPDAWKILDRFKQHRLKAKQSWSTDRSLFKNLLVYLQNLLSLNDGLSSVPNLIALGISIGTIVSVGYAGGILLAEHIPNILGFSQAAVTSEFSVCILVGALAQQTMSLLRSIPSSFESVRQCINPLSKLKNEATPFHTIGAGLDKCVEHGVVYGVGLTTIIGLSSITVPVTVPPLLLASGIAASGIGASLLTSYTLVPLGKLFLHRLNDMVGINLNFKNTVGKIDECRRPRKARFDDLLDEDVLDTLPRVYRSPLDKSVPPLQLVSDECHSVYINKI